MRTYLFTKRDREILESWVNEDVKLSGFRDLKHRIKKHRKRIASDVDLMKKILDKLAEEGE